MTIRLEPLIRKKRDGHALEPDEIRGLIEAYATDAVPEYQVSALLMAVFFQGLDEAETLAWTEAMLHSGSVLDFSDIEGYKVDKHSTGGVGDKVSLILAPLVAECGAKVPMISGRGLGHTGGTLDKLESIPGFRTDWPVSRFRELVDTLGCGLIGQTAEIAPADKRMYALRDVTATVESIPLITASILSKKLAEGIDGLVLDVKTGSGAFMKRLEDSWKLAETMVRIGKSAGKDVVALVTDMDQPLGDAVGNSLEVIESCELLRGRGPADLREVTVALSAEMLVMAGVESTIDAAIRRCHEVLDSGKALERFQRITEAQGGDPRALEDYSRLPTAARRVVLESDTSGTVRDFECDDVGRAAMVLGAGRATKDDVIDPAVGVVMHVTRGERVEKGQPLATLHVNDDANLELAQRQLRGAIDIGDGPAEVRPLIVERIA